MKEIVKSCPLQTNGYSPPRCEKCNASAFVKIAYDLDSAARYLFYWRCFGCKKDVHPKSFLPHTTVREWLKGGSLGKKSHFLANHLINNNSGDYTCDVCGTVGAERHHWVPQCLKEFFDDYERWPQSYLCKKHHDLWHEVVTPYIPGRGTTDASAAVWKKYVLKRMQNGSVI